MALTRRLVLALATGYVFFFYSERVFWSFLRPGDGADDIILGWLVYALFAYITLTLIERCRVRSIWALFLAGTAFGWLTEGIYAMTFFGAGGIVMPFSFVWTGVAWHALFSVLIGWYYLQISLAERGYLHTILLSAIFGLFWGVWAVAWALEEEPLIVTGDIFLMHSIVTTALLILAFRLSSRWRLGSFRASRIEVWGLAAIVAAFTALVTLPAVNVFLPILVVGLGAVFFLLRRNGQRESRTNLLQVFDTRVSWGKHLVLLIMPIVATAVYVFFTESGIIFASNIATFVVSSVIGTALLVVSGYKVLKMRQAGTAQ